MSYFNMVCDSCGREVSGCNIVNGMKFCAKCYQETFGETDKDRKIADLEAKLKESETNKQFYFFENGEKGLKIRELKKQLEKKEKLIERLQGVIDKLRDKKFAGKTLVEAVNAVYEPLFKNKCDEVEEFKQQLKSQPAEIVEKIKEFVDGNAYYYEEEQYAKHIIKYLDDILKEYQK